MPKKILTLWSGRTIGGAPRRFIELTDSLARSGDEVLLLSGKDYPGEPLVKVVVAPISSGRFHALKLRFSPLLKRFVARQLDVFRPDVVFCFGLPSGGALLPVARMRGIPTVIFIRMMEMVLQNNPNVLLGDKPGIGRAAKKMYRALFSAYGRNVLKYADGVVFQHEEQRKAYYSNGLIDRKYPGKVFILPNNSNPSWLPNYARYSLVKEPIAVMASRLNWNKGFRVAIEAFCLVRKRCPEARLIVLGDGTQKDIIQRYANRVGGVEFKGNVEDVGKQLLSSRFLIHPTLDEMGSPNVVLEAAGLGVPMLASDVVRHTTGDYPGSYPAGDHRGLSELWLKALEDDDFILKLSRASVVLGEKYRFDWACEARKIINLIQ